MPSSSHNRFHMKSSRHSIELANADISRLMDPSYHPHTYEPARAYVDHRGEMHDPDFHYFPVYNSRRGRRASDPSSSKSRWEEDEEEEEEEEEDLQAPYYHRRHSQRRTRSAQHSPVRDYPTFPSVSSSPSSTSSPLPSSPYVSVFEEKPHAHHHSLLPKRFRRHSAGSESAPYPSYDDDEEYSDPIQYDDSDSDSEVVDVAARDESLHAHHTDLSYSQAMKKQWVAISLSLRFQIFRARRRASRCRKD